MLIDFLNQLLNRLLIEKAERQRVPDEPVKFEGWIYGDPEDESTLRAWGVKGEMCWRPSPNAGSITMAARDKTGIFEWCEIDSVETAISLYKHYPAFWAGSFTGVNENDEQTRDQPLWKMGHEDDDHRDVEGFIVSNYTLLGDGNDPDN